MESQNQQKPFHSLDFDTVPNLIRVDNGGGGKDRSEAESAATTFVIADGADAVRIDKNSNIYFVVAILEKLYTFLNNNNI